MKTISILSIPAALGLAFALAIPSASAQPREYGPGWGPGMMMGPGMMARGMGAACNPGGAGFVQWRMERIERAIKPTEAQKSALNELRSASAKAAEAVAAACPTDFPKTSSDRLAFMEKRAEAMLQAIRTVRPAFDALYATLSDTQKSSLDAFGAGRRGWGGHGWGWRWRD
jgi:hypothetical protein